MRVGIGIALSLLALCGCGDENAFGTPPSISDLSFSPETITAGEQTQVTGQFTFHDPDGDVAFMAVELRPAGAPAQRIADTPVSGSGGMVDGQVPFTLLIQAAAAGQVDFGVWLIDVNENESNELTGTLMAQ